MVVMKLVEWASSTPIVSQEVHQKETSTICALLLADTLDGLSVSLGSLSDDARHYGVQFPSVHLQYEARFSHWSRGYEYPWISRYGDFQKWHTVLDAGGGDSILQYAMASRVSKVVNLDNDSRAWDRIKNRRIHQRFGKNIVPVEGDILSIPYAEDSFFRVTCVSVLEHVSNPLKAMDELWRVTARGGRLLVTMDVAAYARYNHAIDHDMAVQMLDKFGMRVPPVDPTISWYRFAEENRKPGDPEHVDVRCLCFFVDKE